MPGGQSDEKSFQWTVALVLFGVLFLGVSDTQLVPPLLPLIARDMSITPGHAGTIVTTYSLAAALFALVAGPLSDRVGRKRVLTLGLAVFSISSFSTFYVTAFPALLIVRMLTGLSAGSLSTCSLSYAGDHYSYAQRGRAMGVLSMAYFAALVVGVPVGSAVAAHSGWHIIFAALAVAGAATLLMMLAFLPPDHNRTRSPLAWSSIAGHFRKSDRLAGMIAAFLTSGGIVGFLTYVGAWLAIEQGVAITKVGLIFMAAGFAAIVASPAAGWLSDRIGKLTVIVGANVVLTILFLVVSRMNWGIPLILGIAALSVAASARQAPLHALTTELVGTEVRGEYVALRNAASQFGIATVAALSSYAYDSGGFSRVALIAAVVTALIPIVCIWIREPC